MIDEAQRIIELKPNEDAQFVFTNHIKPSLQLIKLSSDGSRLAGVTFRIAKIEDGSHYLDRTTNSTGEILISDLSLAFIPCVNCPLCRTTSRTIPSTM